MKKSNFIGAIDGAVSVLLLVLLGRYSLTLFSEAMSFKDIVAISLCVIASTVTFSFTVLRVHLLFRGFLWSFLGFIIAGIILLVIMLSPLNKLFVIYESSSADGLIIVLYQFFFVSASIILKGVVFLVSLCCKKGRNTNI